MSSRSDVELNLQKSADLSRIFVVTVMAWLSSFKHWKIQAMVGLNCSLSETQSWTKHSLAGYEQE
jgi:hypothetical protein